MAGLHGRVPRGGDLDAEGGQGDRRVHGPGRWAAGRRAVTKRGGKRKRCLLVVRYLATGFLLIPMPLPRGVGPLTLWPGVPYSGTQKATSVLVRPGLLVQELEVRGRLHRSGTLTVPTRRVRIPAGGVFRFRRTSTMC